MVSAEVFHELMVQENIILQTVAIAVIILALLLKSRKNYVYHADLMLIALLINLVQLLMHMIPSLVSALGGLGPVTYNWGTAIVAVHAIVGIVAQATGTYVIVEWAFLAPGTNVCFRRKGLMRLTVLLWIASYILGMLYYVVHIVIY